MREAAAKILAKLLRGGTQGGGAGLCVCVYGRRKAPANQFKKCGREIQKFVEFFYSECCEKWVTVGEQRVKTLMSLGASDVHFSFWV